SDMLRPTIRNWIKDYYQEMGTGKHDLMQRGDYLYHSKNTKGVSEVERQKLMTIIKSLEDGTLLKIDEQQKEIVFDAYKESQKVDIKSSFKDNFHKKPLFNFLQKKEITLVEEEKKEEDRKNSKSGMEKINKKIQEEATVSSGYFLQKKENKPQEVIKRQMEVKKIEIDKVEAPKKNVVFNQMETMNNNENKIQKKQKDEEKESPYIIKPLSMESNKKRRSDFDISSNVIDLRK
ncbi:MAG: Bt, partial [Candidatus Moranbacteria bacterium GW2011_GWF1_36_4]